MSNRLLTSQIGQHIFLSGHFDVSVALEDALPIGSDDSAGYEKGCTRNTPIVIQKNRN
jgi:hypothetical protein